MDHIAWLKANGVPTIKSPMKRNVQQVHKHCIEPWEQIEGDQRTLKNLSNESWETMEGRNKLAIGKFA